MKAMKEMLRSTISNYLKDVLGIDQVMMDTIVAEDAASSSNAVAGSARGNEKESLKDNSAVAQAAASMQSPVALTSDVEFFIDAKMKFNMNHFDKKIKFLVIHEKKDQSVFVGETAETLTKMIQALKLNPAEMLVLEFTGGTIKDLKADLAQKIKTATRVLLLTEEQHKNQEELVGPHTYFTTYSPFAFIKEASLKKPAWDLMKKFVK